MYNKNTVIVVGAGASKEAGLPTGAELAYHISQLLKFKLGRDGSFQDGDQDFYKQLFEQWQKIGDYKPYLITQMSPLLQCNSLIS